VIAAGVGTITLLSGNLAIGFAAGVIAMALRWAGRFGGGELARSRRETAAPRGDTVASP
jgi:hypothetical protein